MVGEDWIYYLNLLAAKMGFLNVLKYKNIFQWENWDLFFNNFYQIFDFVINDKFSRLFPIFFTILLDRFKSNSPGKFATDYINYVSFHLSYRIRVML